MSQVLVQGVRKAYGSVQVIHGVDIDIKDGEFVVLVGPSGCGKSTLLRMVAGLESITGGQIRIGERVVNNVPPSDRDIAMVFQSYALYPHMKVRENMAFSLRLKKTEPSVIEERVKSAANILGLTPILTVTPGNCPAGSASAWPWAAPSCAIRRSSCSTNRCPISMPSCACRCAPKSRNCIKGSRPRPFT